MAADSATTFSRPDGQVGQIYQNANKVVNLVKGLPIGVMTCGAGGVGPASIATLLKDLRARMAGGDPAWRINANEYTIEQVTGFVHNFFSERAAENDFKGYLMLRICGYSSGRPLPEVWQAVFNDGACPSPKQVQSETDIGPMWEGEFEALNRLIFGAGNQLPNAAQKLFSLTREQSVEAYNKLIGELYQPLILPAAPIQDAVDLARFLVEVTEGFVKFAVNHTKTVGGPIEIAAITKHEAFKWVQRKHFFAHDLNLG